MVDIFGYDWMSNIRNLSQQQSVWNPQPQQYTKPKYNPEGSFVWAAGGWRPRTKRSLALAYQEQVTQQIAMRKYLAEQARIQQQLRQEIQKTERALAQTEREVMGWATRVAPTTRQLRPGQRGYIPYTRRVKVLSQVRRELQARQQAALGGIQSTRQALESERRKYNL